MTVHGGRWKAIINGKRRRDARASADLERVGRVMCRDLDDGGRQVLTLAGGALL